MRERRKSQISRDRWLVSYADFITLLFGLFVVLFAFAKADQKKQMQVSTAIDSAFAHWASFRRLAPAGQRCKRRGRHRPGSDSDEHRDGRGIAVHPPGSRMT